MNTNPGEEQGSELYPIVAAVGAMYGDPNGKYASFLAHVDKAYPAEPYFLWNQPLSDSGWVSRNPNPGGNTAPGNNTVTKNGNNGTGNNASGSVKVVAGTISLAALSILGAWLVA
jgi:hypothetical protein